MSLEQNEGLSKMQNPLLQKLQMKISAHLWSRVMADALEHLKFDIRWFLPHTKEGNSGGTLVSLTSKC